MTTLKQGDLIKDGDGDTYKIIGVCGEVVHVSYAGNHESFHGSYTVDQLKNFGYTWDTPAWEPLIGEKYCYINDLEETCESRWDDDTIDHARRDFLGIYQSKGLCEAAILEIRRKLGK